MKKLTAILLTLISIFSLTACAASFDNMSGGYASPESASPGKGYNNSDTQWILQNFSGSDYEYDYETVSDVLSAQEPSRKVIRTASLDMEAQDALVLYDSLVEYCNSRGGYEFSSDTTHYEHWSVIRATLKIPPEHLDTFMKYAGDNGKVINSQINSEDVTDEFYDLSIRLETKRRSLESYYKLLENAATAEEIIHIQRTIDQITEEIEAVEGRLRVLSNLIDMSTVTLYIRQTNDPEKIRKDIDWSALTFEDMGYLIRNGFVGVINVIVTFVQWVLIIIAVSSPIWVPITVLIIVLVKKAQKKTARIKAAREKNNAQPIHKDGD
ncbi:MAG: DUF4349 domain-containing protein [Oscillospiraceae bacterium]|nr:DUF4349 domain-containing protein [Oscillospiraceae bacterium]